MTEEFTCTSRKKCDWNKCPGLPYYFYHELKFCPHQMRWLIDNLHILKTGEWPIYLVDCSEFRARYYKEPGFHRILEIAEEVEARIKVAILAISGWRRPLKVYKVVDHSRRGFPRNA